VAILGGFMIKYINNKKLKSSKFKLIFTGFLVAVTLTGCNINNTSSSIDSNTTTSSVQELTTYYPITITYDNISNDIYGNEVITFTDGNNHVYNAIRPTNKGYTETNLIDNEGTIYSSYLDKKVSIPNTDTNHNVELTIDYKNKTMDVQVVSIEKQK
jgi:hypothetical protein